MAIPIRNQVFDKIQETGSLTDVELSRALNKDDIDIKEDKLNKILLDLEILGLINVSWITKVARRIEVIKQTREKDTVEEQNKQAAEKEYEVTFSNTDN